ncbi:MAG: hypothetical protein HZA35_00045 [Parcubacteria group bacterium]|nr:hypothetical protein [Parcubacteria group bacterium]
MKNWVLRIYTFFRNLFRKEWEVKKETGKQDKNNELVSLEEKTRRFKRYFLSIVLTESDAILIKSALEGLPLKVFDMGVATVVPMGRKDMPQKSEKEDEVPYRLFFITIESTVKTPQSVKEQVVNKLTEVFSFRWCHGTDMQFDW